MKFEKIGIGPLLSGKTDKMISNVVQTCKKNICFQNTDK